MPAPATCVVLGLGNTLHSDDGIGPQAIERLRSDARVPEDVSLIEGGTLGLELLTYIWDCSYLLVLDAVDVGQPPGTLVRMSNAGTANLAWQRECASAGRCGSARSAPGSGKSILPRSCCWACNQRALNGARSCRQRLRLSCLRSQMLPSQKCAADHIRSCR